MAAESSGKKSISLPNLPEEIIKEILLMLPVKYLVKFKCVSKSWLSLISSPDFIKTHLNISTRESNIDSPYRLLSQIGPSLGSFCTCPLYPTMDEDWCVDEVPFNFPFGKEYCLEIIDSCNGLVCLARSQTVIFWNPATRETRELPHSGVHRTLETRYGFGYDSSNDDYKVVESCYTEEAWGPSIFEVRAYSLRADLWIILDWDLGEIYPIHGRFMNGAIHWEVYSDHTPMDWSITAQNVTSWTCKTIAHPRYECEYSSGVDICLGASRGHLLLSYNYETCMDVWLLKEYENPESWTKVAHIPYDLDEHWFAHERTRPVAVLESGGILLQCFRGLVVYDPLDKDDQVHYLCYDTGADAVVYIESLISTCGHRVA